VPSSHIDKHAAVAGADVLGDGQRGSPESRMQDAARAREPGPRRRSDRRRRRCDALRARHDRSSERCPENRPSSSATWMTQAPENTADEYEHDAGQEDPAWPKYLRQLPCGRLSNRAGEIERRDQRRDSPRRGVYAVGDRHKGSCDQRAVDRVERRAEEHRCREPPRECGRMIDRRVSALAATLVQWRSHRGATCGARSITRISQVSRDP
jgi:hypothetical protein